MLMELRSGGSLMAAVAFGRDDAMDWWQLVACDAAGVCA